MRNQGVGVPVTHIVLGFQEGDHLHMLLIPQIRQKCQPVADGLGVLLFDGRKV